MSSEWAMTTLGECCFSIEDGDWIETKDQGEQGYRLLQISNIGLGQFRETGNYRWVTPETFQRLRCNEIRIGDVLVARMPEPTGRCWYVDNLPWPAITAVDVAIVRTNPELLDPLYCSYFLNSPQTLAEVSALTVGTTRTRIKRTDLASLEIALPSLPIQKSIAALLRVFDDRITLLRETNVTLEAIAQALFKSWFVDFDPVRAKMEGRAPEGMDEATAALFPDSFEETELGVVPCGWRVGCIEDLCKTITNGGTPSRSKPEFWESGIIPWFKTGEFADGFLLQPSEFITQAGLDGSSVKLLPKDAVLMAIYAAPTVGRLGVLTEPATFNQACTGMVAKEKVGPWYLFWTLFFGRDWFNNRANGAAQQNISKAIVAAYKVVLPPDAVLAAFHDVCDVIHTAIRENSTKIQTLATLRDTLLPRLISGQLAIDSTRTRGEVV